MTFDEALRLYENNGIMVLLSKERFNILETILAVPFDPNLHYPLIYLHLYFGILDSSERLLEHCNKNDETYKELEDIYNAFKECEDSDHGVFPLYIPYRNWWNGPHLKFPNPEKITAWYPLKVNYINDKLNCIVAKKENDIIIYGQVEFPIEKAITPEENIMGEIAFYGEDYIIDFHREKTWNLSPLLQDLDDKVMPYVKNSLTKLEHYVKNSLTKLEQETKNETPESVEV